MSHNGIVTSAAPDSVSIAKTTPGSYRPRQRAESAHKGHQPYNVGLNVRLPGRLLHQGAPDISTELCRDSNVACIKLIVCCRMRKVLKSRRLRIWNSYLVILLCYETWLTACVAIRSVAFESQIHVRHSRIWKKTFLNSQKLVRRGGSTAMHNDDKCFHPHGRWVASANPRLTLSG